MSRHFKMLAKSTSGGGGGFTPTDLGSKLKAWYTTPFGSHVNGDHPTSWLDASGNANDATFAGGTAADITYATNIRNGHDVINSINGVRTATTGSAIDYSTGGSFYWVGALAFGTVTEGFIAHSGGDITCRVDSFDPTHHAIVAYDAGAAHVVSSPGLVSTDWNVLNVSFDTGDFRASVNGVDGTPVTASLTWGNTALDIFSVTGASVTWWGYVGEILLCAPRLTSGEHTSVINYLKARWSIA